METKLEENFSKNLFVFYFIETKSSVILNQKTYTCVKISLCQ